MGIEAPKKTIKNRELVTNSSGVAVTAVNTPVKPVKQAPAPTQNINTDFTPAADIQTQIATKESFPAIRSGEFVPSSLQQIGGATQGSLTESAGKVFRDSAIFGTFLSTRDPLPQNLQDRQDTLAANAHKNRPITSFISDGLAYAAASAPIDVPLFIASGGMLNAGAKLLELKGFLKSAKILKGIASSVEEVKLNKNLLSKRALNMAAFNGLTVMASVAIQEPFTKGKKSTTDILTEIFSAGIGGALLGEVLVQGARGFKFTFNKSKGIIEAKKSKAPVSEEAAINNLSEETTKSINTNGGGNVAKGEVGKTIGDIVDSKQKQAIDKTTDTTIKTSEQLEKRTIDKKVESNKQGVLTPIEAGGKGLKIDTSSEGMGAGFKLNQQTGIFSNKAFRDPSFLKTATSTGSESFVLDTILTNESQAGVGLGHSVSLTSFLTDVNIADNVLSKNSLNVERIRIKELLAKPENLSNDIAALLNSRLTLLNKKLIFFDSGHNAGISKFKTLLEDKIKNKAPVEEVVSSAKAIGKRDLQEIITKMEKKGTLSKELAAKLKEKVNPEITKPIEKLKNNIKNDVENAGKDIADFNAKPTKQALTKVISNLLNKKEAKAAKDISNLFEDRATSAGLTLEQYFKVKNLSFAENRLGSVLTVIKDNETIISAPTRATSIRELFDEIGHIIRSDLSKKHLEIIHKEMGFKAGTDANAIGTRAQEEAFSDAFITSVERGRVGNRALTRAMRAVKSWFNRIYGRFVGKPIGAKTEDIIGKLFSTSENQPFATPTRVKERIVARGRQRQGINELFATEPNSERSLFEINDTKTKVVNNLDDVVDELLDTNLDRINFTKEEVAANLKNIEQRKEDIANSVNKSLKEASIIPPDKGQPFASKKLDDVIRWASRMLTSDNMGLAQVLPRLGSVGKELLDVGVKAVNTKAKIHNKITTTFNEFINKIGKGNIPSILNEIKSFDKKVPLEIITKEGKVSSASPRMNGEELRSLYIYAMKSVDNVKLADHKLVKDGVFIGADLYKLTEKQVGELRSGKIVPDSIKEISDAYLKAYGSVSELEDNVRFARGKPVKSDSADISFNSPELTRKINKFAIGLDPSKTTGDPLILNSVPETFNNYRNIISHKLGFIDFNDQLDVFMREASPILEQKLGAKFVSSLKDLQNIMAGDVDRLGNATDGFLDYLFNLETIGILSLNPSVVFKQFASGASAIATGELGKSSVAGIAKNTINLFLNKTELDSTLKKMEKIIPFYFKRRNQSVIASLDDRLISNPAEFQLIFGRNIPIGEFMKKAGESGQGVLQSKNIGEGLTTVGTNVKHAVERGAKFITRADESTMASIYLEVVDDILSIVDKDNNPIYPEGTKKFNELVRDKFTKITLLSQPTDETLSRTFNQMTKGLFGKTFTRFSSQTSKNFQLASGKALDYFRKPKSERTPQDTADLLDALVPLGIQSIYITSVGLAMSEGINLLTSQLSSKKEQRRLAKLQDSIFEKFGVKFISELSGNTPISGDLFSNLTRSVFGGRVFSDNLPVFGNAKRIAEGISERNVIKAFDSIARMAGTPNIIRKPIKSLLK